VIRAVLDTNILVSAILVPAVSARADYLVTGDRQLLALHAFQGVQIVSPREFLSILALPDVEP
jgi:predicted nucleic acid-binding protein